jgi:hypothetical protein
VWRSEPGPRLARVKAFGKARRARHVVENHVGGDLDWDLHAVDLDIGRRDPKDHVHRGSETELLGERIGDQPAIVTNDDARTGPACSNPRNAVGNAQPSAVTASGRAPSGSR